jgi:hypothetical protein
VPPEEPKKTPEEIRIERNIMMAKAAIKVALTSFNESKLKVAPEELQDFWKSLNPLEWREHLEYFTREIRKYKQVKVKEILYDLANYIKDCKKAVPNFKRTKEEILLMIAIGQIDPSEFIEKIKILPSNREKLDRKIQKQLKKLDWEDQKDLEKLDELTSELDNPKIKKKQVEEIDRKIDQIEANIKSRKVVREDLAIRLVEWKTRGTIDIAGGQGEFRLDA